MLELLSYHQLLRTDYHHLQFPLDSHISGETEATLLLFFFFFSLLKATQLNDSFYSHEKVFVATVLNYYPVGGGYSSEYYILLETCVH